MSHSIRNKGPFTNSFKKRKKNEDEKADILIVN